MKTENCTNGALRRMDSRAVMVTGAAGNLGSKLVRALAKTDWCSLVLAVDQSADSFPACFDGLANVETLSVDLTSLANPLLDESLNRIDTIVHFAVVNPLPDATWAEAARSFDMTASLLMRARDLGVRRFVFASSNHVVGQYKEPPLIDGLTDACLTTDLFAPGTRWETADGVIDGYAYGSAKVFAERMCIAAAQVDGLSTVSIRVGWCQVGENHPTTINAGGNPTLSKAGLHSRSSDTELRWYRNMWLSTPDFVNLFEQAILTDTQHWPRPGIVVNGMSANSGMAWDIGPAKQLLGYQPIDDVWSCLAKA